MSEQSLGRRWTRTTAPYFTLRGLGQAAEVVGWILLARRLGASSFGVLSVAALVCRYGGLVADWGASVSGIRDVAAKDRDHYIAALIRRRELVTAALALVYIGGAWATGHADLVPLVTILMSLGLSRDWVALGREKGGISATPVFLQGVVLLLIAGLGPVSQPALPAAIAYAVSLVASLALNRVPRSRAVADGPVVLDAWMLLAVLSNQVLSSADTILLAAMTTTAIAGVYAAVYRIPNAWLALVVILRGSLLAIATTTLRTDRQGFLALRRTSLRWGLVAGGILVALTPVAYLAVPYVFGPQYASGSLAMAIILLATAVATVAAPLHHLYLAFGDDRPYGLYLFGAAALNIGANLVLIPTFGMNGAAVATVVANVFLAAILWRGLARRIATIDVREDRATERSARAD